MGDSLSEYYTLPCEPYHILWVNSDLFVKNEARKMIMGLGFTSQTTERLPRTSNLTASSILWFASPTVFRLSLRETATLPLLPGVRLFVPYDQANSLQYPSTAPTAPNNPARSGRAIALHTVVQLRRGFAVGTSPRPAIGVQRPLALG